MFARLMTILMILVAHAAAASAQSIVMPDGKATPREGSIRYERDGTVPVVVHHVDTSAAVFADPDGKTPRVIAASARPKFMEQFLVAYAFPNLKDPERLLLARADGKFAENVPIGSLLGWVEAAAVLRTTEALRDDETQVYLKAMIVNTEASIAAKEIGAQPYSTPRGEADSKIGQEHRLVTPYFIYARSATFAPQVVAGGRPVEAPKHYLLGNRQQFDVQRSAAPDNPDIIGWVRADRLALWRTREAFEWDTRNTLPTSVPRRTVAGVAYATQAEAVQAGLRPKGQTLFQEVLIDGISKPMRTSQRYPILGVTGVTRGDGADQAKLFKVGMWGGLTSGKGANEASAEDIENFLNANEKMKDELNKIHVAFVIDGTNDLAHQTKALSTLIKSVTEKLRDEGIRLGGKFEMIPSITFYGDAQAPAALLRSMDLSFEQYGTMEGQDFIDKVNDFTKRTFPVAATTGRQLFDGIEFAVKQSKFLNGTLSPRMVVVIGRNGDFRGNEADKRSKELAELMINHQVLYTPIQLLSLQLVDDNNGTPEVRSFQTQMKQLLQHLAEAAARKTRGEAAGKADTVHVADRANDFVGREAETRFQVVAALVNGIVTMRRGAVTSSHAFTAAQRGDFSELTVGQLNRLRLVHGDTIDKLRDRKLAQFFSEAYVWSHGMEADGKPMRCLREMGLMSDAEIAVLLEATGGLTRQGLNAESYSASLTGAADRLVSLQVGDYSARLGIRADQVKLNDKALLFKSALLLQARYNDVPGFNQFTIQQYHDLVQRVTRLKDLQENRIWKYERKPEVHQPGDLKYDAYERVGNPLPGTPERSFKLRTAAGNVNWHWVDLREEWP